jgi:hypothetical protein
LVSQDSSFGLLFCGWERFYLAAHILPTLNTKSLLASIAFSVCDPERNPKYANPRPFLLLSHITLS